MSEKVTIRLGRPAVFDTPEDFQVRVDLYFNECEAADIPPLLTGLAFHMGFQSRQSLYDYEKKTDFSYAVKRARLRVEMAYEAQLASSARPTGAIFALKNMGWTDRQRVEHTRADAGDPRLDAMTDEEMIARSEYLRQRLARFETRRLSPGIEDEPPEKE
jgi:DNA-packaging protein gp3